VSGEFSCASSNQLSVLMGRYSLHVYKELIYKEGLTETEELSRQLMGRKSLNPKKIVSHP